MIRPDLRQFALLLCTLFFGLSGAGAQAQADEQKLETFLEVTGFDVALESMRVGATNAPQILGMEANDFGVRWTMLADEVFEPAAIRRDAKDLLGKALSDEMLTHAADFYASDLGQRLVAVENAAHAAEDTPDDVLRGEALVAEMVEEGSPRLEYFKRMNTAIDPENIGIQAAQEVQIRFLLAASDAGVINRIDEATLRSLMEEQAAEMALEIKAASLANSARIYEAFTDDDLEAYADALEHPVMQKVYELMNGVQYALMADRYEKLALRMAELSPGQEL
ncbi:DUF2059 domain-containing protein [Lentibacter sp. XHP0401]|jgi:Uncharacterized protein conserved in bacteria (DUF2059)|uniref:DUF2059 domain-containing protein n=1 Tax=Lentibacter sp. XHP0401 TaxID=2984334 RepID=UPI0021E893AF|nr:DUF2059 domain-containing protein [Lentibacter sp. XHP0401]MCV2892016.1 DUF2059 domain-containing protein [Lentibacter sp. XHP0401]